MWGRSVRLRKLNDAQETMLERFPKLDVAGFLLTEECTMVVASFLSDALPASKLGAQLGWVGRISP